MPGIFKLKKNTMTKRKIARFIKSANELLAKTKGTMIVYNVYADGCYALDTEEDNVISVERTEADAKELIEDINEESGYNTGCYYKPILIDADTGNRITRENIKQYI